MTEDSFRKGSKVIVRNEKWPDVPPGEYRVVRNSSREGFVECRDARGQKWDVDKRLIELVGK